MSSPLGIVLTTAIPLALAVTFYAVLYSPGREKQFPPGPRGLPLVGSVLDFEPNAAWKRFTDWRGAYGVFPSFHYTFNRLTL